MSDTNSELISIHVPKEYLKEIYGFISTLGPARAAEKKSEPQWLPELIARQFDESPDIIKRFQKILASQPGKKIYTAEMATKLKAAKGSKTVAGALGAYGRRVLNRYKMPAWPFKTEWDHVKKEQCYWMDADVAALIKGR